MLFCLGIATSRSDGADIHKRYFSGLRERALYLIAEDYAVSQLNGNRLLPDEQARITIELAITLADHGSYSSVEQRQELWKEAERLLQEFVKESPQNPRAVEVQAELAILPARFGESLAWEVELNSSNQRAKTKAVQFFQIAVKAINQFQSTLSTSKTKPTASDLADGALTSEELVHLKQKIAYYEARSKLFLALHSERGPNRAGLLIEAANQLDQLAKSRSDSLWKVQAKLLRARLARREEDYPRARAILNSLQASSSEFSIEDEVLAEQVRVELDQGQIDAGLKLITDHTRAGHAMSDEVRAVAVEGLLAAWKIAGKKEITNLQTELLTEAQGHHELTRGKWHQLTFARLQHVHQSLDLGDELAQLIRDAQSNFHANKLNEAVVLFRRAAAVAHRERKDDLAVEYAFTAGSIEVQQRNWTAAVLIYAEIVEQFPKNSKSSDAGLMQCYALGQIYSNQPNAETRVSYESALQALLQQFAATSAAIEATWMLAVHQERRLQWTDAVELYKKIPPEHPRYDSAMLRVIILYEKILTRLREINGPINIWEDQLLQEIVTIEEHFPSGNVLRSLEQCQTSLMVAQLLLQHRDRWYGVADQWLARIEKTVEYQRIEASINNTNLDAKWLQINRAAAQMRIVSLAGQEKLQDAREILLELQKTDPTTMLGILLGLTEMSSKIDARHQVELGHLQLEAINQLTQSRAQLTKQQQKLLDDSHAEAFIAIGNLPEAANIYESLIEKSPRSERLMRKVIAVLMKRGKAEDLLKAREWWTKVERLHSAGSEAWIESRLEIARLDDRLGKTEDARKLLGITQALYPKLGTPELKQRFEELRAQLSRK